jgi:hypothetical protein
MSGNTETIPASDLPERLPQRFRYRKPGCNYRYNGWDYGVCNPCGDGWESKSELGDAWFGDDPWEVLGQILGDVEAFEWIDNDFGWEGMKNDDDLKVRELPKN